MGDRLTKRFGIPPEPVILTVPESDTWIMTARCASERNSGRGTAVVPTDTGQKNDLDVPSQVRIAPA
jgi:hypothetical protein